MDARNVFSHPNLEQTIRPINIVVDGSDKRRVWARQGGSGGDSREPKEPPDVGKQHKQQQRRLVTLLQSYEQAERNCHQAGRGGEEWSSRGSRGYCVQRESFGCFGHGVH